MSGTASAQASATCQRLAPAQVGRFTQTIRALDAAADGANEKDRERLKAQLADTAKSLGGHCGESTRKAIAAIGQRTLDESDETLNLWIMIVRVTADIAAAHNDFDGAESILLAAADKSFARVGARESCGRSLIVCTGQMRQKQGHQQNSDAAFERAIHLYRDRLLPAIPPSDTVAQFIGQLNLGQAIYLLGERRQGPDGLMLLRDSAASFEKALTLLSRDESPRLWARAQWNLGSALGTAARRGGPDNQEINQRAIDANRLALEILTIEENPEEWASAQSNLATSLMNKWIRMPDPRPSDLLSDAASGFTNALRVYKKETKAEYWASMQNSLGNVLAQLSFLRSGQDSLALQRQAISSLNQSLEVQTKAGMPVMWAITNANIASLLQKMARTEPAKAKEHLAKAERILSDALAVLVEQKAEQTVPTARETLAQIREERAKAS